jgi:hypothetical protein
MRSPRLPLAVLVLWTGLASAQTSTNGFAATNSTPAAIEERSDKWSFSASVYTYIAPDSREYVQPTFTADDGWLHLEARYNYEGLNTGSAWIGYNFSAGDKLAIEFTPMLGGVFGDTTGIAPGYKASLSWWKLALSTEGEYLIDTGSTSDSFFYTWSELSLAPVEWLRFGGVIQRTKLYETEFDIQRGFLLGFSFKRVNVTGYIFDPFESKPVYVFAAGLTF